MDNNNLIIDQEQIHSRYIYRETHLLSDDEDLPTDDDVKDDTEVEDIFSDSTGESNFN